MTGIYCKTNLQSDLIQCLKEGKTFITTGPFLCIGFAESPFESIVSSHEIALSNQKFAVTVKSSQEFGFPIRIRLYCGELQSSKETRFFSKNFSGSRFSIQEPFSVQTRSQRGYIRAEVQCKTEDGAIHRALTSPCYFYK